MYCLCPLCGTTLHINEDGYLICWECNFNEAIMAIDEETFTS